MQSYSSSEEKSSMKFVQGLSYYYNGCGAYWDEEYKKAKGLFMHAVYMLHDEEFRGRKLYSFSLLFLIAIAKREEDWNFGEMAVEEFFEVTQKIAEGDEVFQEAVIEIVDQLKLADSPLTSEPVASLIEKKEETSKKVEMQSKDTLIRKKAEKDPIQKVLAMSPNLNLVVKNQYGFFVLGKGCKRTISRAPSLEVIHESPEEVDTTPSRNLF